MWAAQLHRVPTSLLSLVAIQFIGISVGQATWAGVTVLVSFIWASVLMLLLLVGWSVGWLVGWLVD